MKLCCCLGPATCKDDSCAIRKKWLAKRKNTNTHKRIVEKTLK